MTDTLWRDRFPALFKPSFVDYAAAHVHGTTEQPPLQLVSRLHLVAVTSGGRVVVCRSDRGWRFLPGGTREPGETLADLAAREVAEEAGAEIAGPVQLFVSQVAESTLPRPYRPHQPHPRAWWAYGVAEARVTGKPTNPADAEQVVEVAQLRPADAAEFLAAHDPVAADVVRLADAMGLIGAAAVGPTARS